ncbi:MAG: alpha/beta hydrolase [Phycisphaeraceae bacterium]|nr:alpha/beta hydrolase [Phycisphaeraceae bacterium]
MSGLLVLFAVALLLVLLIGTAGLVRSIMHPRRKTLAIALAKGDPTEPAEVGLQAEEVDWSLTGGVSSPGWIIQGRRADLAPIIVIHGHRNSRYGTLRRAVRLVDYASQVVIFDLPAHGDATGGRCTLGADEPADVAKIIEQLAAPRVLLYGSSMGAGIALGAALQCPQQVGGVIVEGVFPRWRQPVWATMRLRRCPPFPFTDLAGLVMRLLGVRLGYDRVADAAKLHCPLLVLHGEQDAICPLAGAKAVAAAARRSTLMIFPGAAHENMAEADESTYRAAVERFVNALAEPVQSGQVCQETT